MFDLLIRLSNIYRGELIAHPLATQAITISMIIIVGIIIGLIIGKVSKAIRNRNIRARAKKYRESFPTAEEDLATKGYADNHVVAKKKKAVTRKKVAAKKYYKASMAKRKASK